MVSFPSRSVSGNARYCELRRPWRQARSCNVAAASYIKKKFFSSQGGGTGPPGPPPPPPPPDPPLQLCLRLLPSLLQASSLRFPRGQRSHAISKYTHARHIACFYTSRFLLITLLAYICVIVVASHHFHSAPYIHFILPLLYMYQCDGPHGLSILYNCSSNPLSTLTRAQLKFDEGSFPTSVCDLHKKQDP